jgi:hypothetical protein
MEWFRSAKTVVANKVLTRWLFRHSIVTDGNFHADHMKMRNLENDGGLGRWPWGTW